MGSTALSLTLDPEETHAVMDDALERGSAVVASHHGKILKYAGDSLLAVFGGEQAQEDANISEHGEIVKAWMNRQAVAH